MQLARHHHHHSQFINFLPSFKITEISTLQPKADGEKRNFYQLGTQKSRASSINLLDLMSNKGCELCSKPARMYCESDQASLCWDCDEKVHAANFLVAKHCRMLLCHVCTSPTQWKASGLKLGPAVSVCSSCVEGEARGRAEGCGVLGNGNQDCDSQESESDDGEYYSNEEDGDEEEGEEDEEEGDNQVVPWSICTAATPSAPASSSSSGEDASFSLWKRMRDHQNPTDLENEEGCCSSHNLDSKLASPDSSFQESENLDSSEQTLFRPLKLRRTNTGIASIPSERTESGQSPANSSAAVVRTVLRFQQETMAQGRDTSSVILGICKLTRDS